MRHSVSYVALATALLLTLSICGCKEKESQQHPNTITVLTYSEYIAPEMITDFQMKTGYRLQLELYEAQEDMLERLQKADTNKYDVVIASDVVIQGMVQQGLIAPIDMSKIPNRVNVADQFNRPVYDPSNTYTLPYLWGTTGILYRDSSFDANHVSYSMLFTPSETRGKFSLLDESRSMLSIALLAKGFDANSMDSKEIDLATDLLQQTQKNPHFNGFDGSVANKEKVISGKNWAAVVFNGEAMDAINEDSTLQYAIPTEGSFMWVDAMTLSTKSTNKDGAYAFMNYILDAKIGAQLAKHINFATPNKASLEVLDSTFKNNRVINPTKEEIDRMVFLRDPGDAAKTFDDAWKSVKLK
ncbi:MAG: spermidine/putrescine ABC transporter substrate-binding protein [Fibrobacter sp.]|nr:spermidine/putrescine ABC transporter substrate-binding protein [Fibrobacter sp.]